MRCSLRCEYKEMSTCRFFQKPVLLQIWHFHIKIGTRLNSAQNIQKHTICTYVQHMTNIYTQTYIYKFIFSERKWQRSFSTSTWSMYIYITDYTHGKKTLGIQIFDTYAAGRDQTLLLYNKINALHLHFWDNCNMDNQNDTGVKEKPKLIHSTPKTNSSITCKQSLATLEVIVLQQLL